MDAFHQYDNMAGFFVGNEVLTTGNDSIAAPFVKAAARDMKAYRDSKGYRNIPVGYSAADIASLRPNLQNYLACGSNASDALDFFALNAYEWCGQSDINTSGYMQLNEQVMDYPIPIFFSETGCNTPAPRTFDDQAAIFGDKMSPYWSGAIIYEWLQEANNYGLISYGPQVAATATNAPDGFTRTGTPTPVMPDFSNLSNQWKTLSPTGVAASAYTPSNSPPACPAATSGLWNVNGDVVLPTLNQVYSSAMNSATGAVKAQITSASGAHSGSSSRTTGTAAAASSTQKGAAVSVSVTGNAGLVGLLFAFIWLL